MTGGLRSAGKASVAATTRGGDSIWSRSCRRSMYDDNNHTMISHGIIKMQRVACMQKIFAKRYKRIPAAAVWPGACPPRHAIRDCRRAPSAPGWLKTFSQFSKGLHTKHTKRLLRGGRARQRAVSFAPFASALSDI